MTERLRRAFEVGPNRINSAQAEALAALLEHGTLEGTQCFTISPPTAVSLAGMGEPEGPHGERPLAVVAQDGRAWSIKVDGTTWPVGHGERDVA